MYPPTKVFLLIIHLTFSNVIVNETLPIVFDSVLGGGWPAVVLSTVLIVIFGEVIPQAACVRYGLPIGARCSTYEFQFNHSNPLDSFLG